MNQILLFALYCLPATQCMPGSGRGKEFALNKEIHPGSTSLLASQSESFKRTGDPIFQDIPSSTLVHGNDEKNVLVEPVEKNPQMIPRPHGREKGVNLAINEVENPNSPEGKEALVELLLKDLNYISTESPELESTPVVFGLKSQKLEEALEEVDKLLLLHIKHRLSVLTLGQIKLPSSKKTFPALEVLEHGNIFRNIFSDQSIRVPPTETLVKKTIKKISKHFNSISGKNYNVEDIPAHAKAPVHEGRISDIEYDQYQRSMEPSNLVEKMRILHHEIDFIPNQHEILKLRFRIAYSKSLNFMYKHELIAPENLQSLFDKRNLEYAASHMTSLNDWYHIENQYDAGKFWYPTVTQGVYNRWYTSDFNNFFPALQEKQKEYFSYFLLVLKARKYLDLDTKGFEKCRFQGMMDSFWGSFLAIEPARYYEERANALETIWPEIQEAVQLFRMLKDDASGQGDGLAIILLSQFFEFLQVYHPRLFPTQEEDPYLIHNLKLLQLSKTLLTEADKLSPHILDKFCRATYLNCHNIKSQNYARKNLAELEEHSEHIGRMIHEHSNAVDSLLQDKHMNQYFFYSYVQKKIQDINQDISYYKKHYELVLPPNKNF
ncbi:hypothetical protein PTTG_25566 [Puccinia triticina 1-1 BBBD Race 1]|uniref:Uncharacterized protein n=1 Tax=Puccinia triticina (isolate 1-1 / race 1 (BBBD)) TaxID=630390 RepID=A0A180H1N5_PUCT1|nr:hypothetical protein PTTG_25566 [Puccinia triticina 1-1 BBBD Race 1]WAR58523.1 hypothetical protein PtB15_5B757 [Puccinia triticina]